MVMVGCRDGDSVDGLILEQLAQVGVTHGTLSLGFFYLAHPSVEDRLIDVADGSDFHVRHLTIRADMAPAPAAHAHAGHPHGVVGTCQGTLAERSAGRGHRSHHKVSSIHVISSRPQCRTLIQLYSDREYPLRAGESAFGCACFEVLHAVQDAARQLWLAQ